MTEFTSDKTSGCDEHCDELDFSPRLRFDEVLKGEYEEIAKRRRQPLDGRPRKIRALSLSGGGLRSATFNLGFLQALNDGERLDSFDYFSTVSGGGYVGGWWSAWLARAERKPGDVFPPPEAIETDRDDQRARIETAAARDDYEVPQVKDSAITAGRDPIHHLRLFSNFLTPNKGLLSTDTWRAVAVIGRNLILTWLILVPIMLAVIMLGQSYFALTPRTAHGFLWRPDLSRYVTSRHQSGDVAPEQMQPQRNERNAGDLKQRFIFALLLPALLYVGSVVCVALWMVWNRRCWALRDILVVILSGVAWLILTAVFYIALGIPWNPFFAYSLILWFVILFAIAIAWSHEHSATFQDTDYWRARLVDVQTRTLQYSVFVGVVLLFAAFGHEFVDFLLFNQQLKSGVMSYVGRAGGWAAVAMAVLSSIYTASTASPTGGNDASMTKEPSILDRVAFALAPPLLLAILGLFLAWCGHRLYTTVYADQDGQLWFILRGALVSALLFLVFALYEFRPPQKWKTLIVITTWLAISIAQYYVSTVWLEAHLLTVGGFAALAMAVGLALRAFFTRKPAPVLGGAFVVAAIGVWLLRYFWLSGVHFDLHRSHVPQLVVGGIVASFVLLVFELVAGRGANTRSVSLMTIGFLMFVLIGAAACTGTAAWRSLTMVVLISSILGWVLALGWLADPNALTVHGFYKARLVRAYMGASNERRGEVSEADVTDAVPGDDVLLTDLKNTDLGAPYHLINTTLNLVGGRDLATQQRLSDSYLLSKRFCGSFRTGFRRTNEYACGTTSLGTAVAVSGAAASPNMGALTPSAALAALMTLFNIRLGFWAPTPNRSYWRTASARLWPVYTIQELVSQTTDLLPFCYLTDGGHFDNSGVYSLIQRGCNFIVFADCGADPTPTLDDIGNLIRKVRIDFQTEITFEKDELLTFRNNPPTAHFITGKIQYAKAHADAIGLPDDERIGTILIVKPNRTAGASADVQQYGWTNLTFPQQSTGDLWYDEAQFESYRKLGQLSGAALVATGKV